MAENSLETVTASSTYYELANQVEGIDDSINEIYTSIRNFNNLLEPREKAYFDKYTWYLTKFGDDLNNVRNNSIDVSNWLKGTTDDYVNTDAKVREIAGGMGSSASSGGYGSGSSGSSSLPSSIETKDLKNLTIDPASYQALPKEVKEKIVEKLKQAGYTDDEIQDIISGVKTVNKLTTEKIQATIEECIKENLDVAKLIEKTAGFSILDENGNVDLNKLQIVEHVATKNLGMDIDLSAGSDFSNHLNELSKNVTKINGRNPELRKEIQETYGIDIIDDNGLIDKNKLALIRVIDGQNNDDEYDFTKMIEKYKADLEDPVTTPQTQAPQTQAPQTQAPQTQAPQTQAPQTQAPQTQAPQTTPTPGAESGNGGGYKPVEGSDASHSGVEFDGSTLDVDNELEKVKEQDATDGGVMSAASLDEIINGSKYQKIPSTSKPILSTNQSKKSSAIPIAAGMAVAAATGIGAKAYMDYKNSKNIGDDDDYEEFEIEGLDDETKNNQSIVKEDYDENENNVFQQSAGGFNINDNALEEK